MAWPLLIDLDGRGGEALGKADPLLERLLDLLVVQGVARRIDEAPAIGDGDPAPALDELADAGGASLGRGRGPLRPKDARVRQELLGDLALLLAPPLAQCRLARLGRERFVAGEELLHLDRIVG